MSIQLPHGGNVMNKMKYNPCFMGKMIKYARELRGMTQDDAAEVLNISDSFYKQIEQGKGNPSLANFQAIIEYYNLSADSLLYPGDTDQNSLENQNIRLIKRCNPAEQRLINALITTLLSNNDDSLRNHEEPTLESLYAKAYAEIDYKAFVANKKKSK